MRKQKYIAGYTKIPKRLLEPIPSYHEHTMGIDELISSKPHIEFYIRCLNGHLPKLGLCSCATHGLIDKKLLSRYFVPRKKEKKGLKAEGLPTVFWGYGENAYSSENLYYGFTPLRQTIVLFMACISGEFD